MKQIIIIAALLGIAVAFTAEDYQNAFTNWMLANKKIYTTLEFVPRFNAFKANMDYVRDWNAAGSTTVLGLNLFADMTNAEYKSTYLGTPIDASERLLNAPTFTLTESLPDTVNWVLEGAVTGVKNQGYCGSGWTFSTTGSIEAAYVVRMGSLVDLSEQNLLDCSYSYGNRGCNGGSINAAFQYVIDNHGIDTEASYPYEAATSYNCRYKNAKRDNAGASISSYDNVTPGSETHLAEATTIGPISVAIDASNLSFQLYSSGVYYESACSSLVLDHGVLVVGYGAESAADQYWLVKNSYGTAWGESGYVKMSRNRDNNCGIASMASYPSV